MGWTGAFMNRVSQASDGAAPARPSLPLLAIVASVTLVTFLMALVAGGPLPGDLSITLWMQAQLGNRPPWAQLVTDGATMPGVLATIGLVAVLVVGLIGRKAIFWVAMAFGFARLTDWLLRASIMIPRPSPDLVAVASPSSSSSLPSTLGLVYGALYGVLFFSALMSDKGWRHAVAGLSAVMLMLGGIARVVLGGHWASQMVASLLLGVLLAGGAQIVVSWMALNLGRR